MPRHMPHCVLLDWLKIIYVFCFIYHQISPWRQKKYPHETLLFHKNIFLIIKDNCISYQFNGFDNLTRCDVAGEHDIFLDIFLHSIISLQIGDAVKTINISYKFLMLRTHIINICICNTNIFFILILQWRYFFIYLVSTMLFLYLDLKMQRILGKRRLLFSVTSI